ncbi:hypothetical protein SBA2_10017 [Acidobacteriia bacterium SbA2]|nr:hypothetical protein SBA2_10017 [Acidobacteriia bacterium SbA2]
MIEQLGKLTLSTSAGPVLVMVTMCGGALEVLLKACIVLLGGFEVSGLQVLRKLTDRLRKRVAALRVRRGRTGLWHLFQ